MFDQLSDTGQDNGDDNQAVEHVNDDGLSYSSRRRIDRTRSALTTKDGLQQRTDMT